jgi:hypothetical protein
MFLSVRWLVPWNAEFDKIFRVRSPSLSVGYCEYFELECKEVYFTYASIVILLTFSPVAQQPPVGQGLLIIEASRSHSDTPHTVGCLGARDHSDAETST